MDFILFEKFFIVLKLACSEHYSKSWIPKTIRPMKTVGIMLSSLNLIHQSLPIELE